MNRSPNTVTRGSAEVEPVIISSPLRVEAAGSSLAAGASLAAGSSLAAGASVAGASVGASVASGVAAQPVSRTAMTVSSAKALIRMLFILFNPPFRLRVHSTSALSRFFQRSVKGRLIPRVFPRLSRFFTCVKNLELSGDFGGCARKKNPASRGRGRGGGRAQRRAGLAYFSSLMAAWAAARRAIGTRKGEQET